MAISFLRQLTTRLSFTILAATVFLSGCRTMSDRKSHIQSSESELPTDAFERLAVFSEISEGEFHTLRNNSDAEFLGCLCESEAADRTKWVGWQFLKVGTNGYRTSTHKKTYDDLEACVAMREILMECED